MFDPFRRHDWSTRSGGADVGGVLERMSPERVIFGSGWPHIDGVPEPLDSVDELAGTGPGVHQRVLRDDIVATTPSGRPRPVRVTPRPATSAARHKN